MHQLGREIPSHRDDTLAVHAEACPQDPVFVVVGLQQFPSRCHIMDPDGAVGASEGHPRPVGREGHPEEGILTDGDRAFQLARGDVPELQLSETGRRPTPRHQGLSVRGKGQRLDAVGETHQAALQPASVRAVQQNLPVARDGQQRTVGRVGQGRNHGRRGVDGRLAL